VTGAGTLDPMCMPGIHCQQLTSDHVGIAAVTRTPSTGGVRVTVRPASRASAANTAELTTVAPPGSLLKSRTRPRRLATPPAPGLPMTRRACCRSWATGRLSPHETAGIPTRWCAIAA
jgi:hypothetical protein